MCVGVLPAVCLCIVYMPGTQGDQKRTSHFLELDLQTIVSCHVGIGN